MILSACVAAGFRLHSSTKFATSTDVLYSATDMGLWCDAEMVCGFMVLCLTAMPKLVRDSPWVRAITSIFKSLSKYSFTDRSTLSIRDRLSVPNRRRRQPTDASLFTDTDKSDFVPLTNVSVRSEFSVHVTNVSTQQTKDAHPSDTLP
jgi:uncharacterized protein with NAD-binding domain and iron-sulfur cluster